MLPLMEDNTEAVEAITESILASRKYHSVSHSLIQEVARRELPRRRNLQEATKKRARSKLHQIAGAFIEEQPPYAKWLAELEAAREGGEPTLMEACLSIMKHHSSARERVPSLRDFYTTVFDGIGPIELHPRYCLRAQPPLDPLDAHHAENPLLRG